MDIDRLIIRIRNDALRELTAAGAPVTQEIRDALDKLVTRLRQALRAHEPQQWPDEETTQVNPLTKTQTTLRWWPKQDP